MIDTSNWKKFRVGGLFTVYNGLKYPKNRRKEGELPLISNTAFNNGIDTYIEDRADSVYDNFISVAYGSGTGVAFYHIEKHFVGETVMALVPKFDMNEYIGEFIASVLTVFGQQYFTYDKKPKVEEYRSEIQIFLPATTDGRPDWDYMESYMKAVMEESEKSLENLKRADGAKRLINVSEWGEFRIDDVFNIVKGTRLTKADMKDGTIKFVGSSAMNNGETHRIANNEKLHPANTITVCYNGSVGETFYQDERFWASDDVNVLYPKFDMTKEMAMFVCPIIKSVGQKYAFVDKWKQEDMKNEVIKLPIDTNGEPDWQYMEDYMRKQFKEAESAISKLQLVV